MALDDLGQNLRLLCSYGRSVSDICRKLKINRQQFNRYLAGTSKPSLNSVRRICDFFGIEDHEIFLDHAEFSELIRLRPPRMGQSTNPLHGFFERLCQSPDQMLKEPAKYTGYYYFYFQPDRHLRVIYRNLIRLYQHGDVLMSKQIERYPNSEFNLPRVMRHEGIVYSVSDRLVITEREEQSGTSLWHSIFYCSDYNRVTFLSGLTLGINPDSAHDVICCRSLLEYLGQEIDVREALSGCGGYEPTSSEVSDYILYCVTNDLPETATAMMPKY